MAAVSREVIDCRRLLCPMPVIRVQDKVAELSPGDEVEAICTDPGALNDIPAWCRINGHEVLGTKTTDDNLYIVIVRVGEDEK